MPIGLAGVFAKEAGPNRINEERQKDAGSRASSGMQELPGANSVREERKVVIVMNHSRGETLHQLSRRISHGGCTAR